MLQEMISHQDDTIQFSQTSQGKIKKIFFGKNFLKIKMIIRKKNKKNDKSKNFQLEDLEDNSSFCSDNAEDQQVTTATSSSSSETSTPLPITSTSMTSFSDNSSIVPESFVDSSTKSSFLFPFFKASTISTSNGENNEEIPVPFNGQENLEDLTLDLTEKKKKKLFNFSKNRSFGKKLRNIINKKNNCSTCSVNDSIKSLDNNQNDSAYESDNYDSSTKKDKKKRKKKSQENKIIRRTKLTTLSKKDKEYIDIENFFYTGLPGRKILGIIRLQMPTKLVEAHEKYKKEVVEGNNLSESQISHRMFHGTKTAFLCRPQQFINSKVSIFCKMTCGVCGIIQEGNKTKYSHYTQRMWFANSSATSLSYCSGNNVKAMFVVDVISAVPNTILIVDKDEATIPRYLIVFQDMA